MFIEEVSTVGANKLQKKWTSPVVKLPVSSRMTGHVMKRVAVADRSTKFTRIPSA